MATKRKTGRLRFGYSGCGTDLVVFTLLGAGAIWGIHHWNGLLQHPFHLGRIPMPSALAKLPVPVRRWLRPDPLTPAAPPIAEDQPTPGPSVPTGAVATSAPVPLPSAPPSATPAEPLAPSPSLSPGALPSPDSGKSQLAATVVKLDPKVSDSPSALQASATVLAQRGGRLYFGLPDGGIALWNGDTRKGHGTVVRLPAPAGPVRAITAGADGTVWWLAGTDGHLYSYRPKGKLLRSLDLSMLGTAVAASDDLGVLPGQSEYGSVVLLGKGSTAIVDGETGALRSLADVLPADAATALDQPEASAFLALDSVKRETLLLVLSGATASAPTALSLWSTKTGDHPNSWKSEAVDGASTPTYSSLRYTESGRSCVALGPGGIALLAKPAGGQTLAACNLWTTQLTQAGPLNLQAYKTLPDGVFGLWAAPDRIALGRSGLWWVFGGTIFHAALPAGRPEAYLPWNGAGDDKHGKIASILADDTGLWVATDTGVRRIAPAHPSADLGYGGYLRAPLGSDAAQAPGNPTDQKLAQLTQEWQGTPYKWGGDSKSGIDCSGYVCKLFGGVGITVPRATGELANGSEGKRVRDELRYGDVLVFPGHCGMYIGNGWTTEALDAGVGKAAIWSRKNVLVKRFLK